MRDADAYAKENTPHDDKPHRRPTAFNFRDSLPSIESMKRYDEYLKEHKRRLTQLEKEARGEMSSSVGWYHE